VNSNVISCIGAFRMGARHSTRRGWSFDDSVAAGDATSATGKSSHRSSTSSGKFRTRWSKVARSHSDRTPATLSTNRLNHGETSVTKYLLDSSPAKSCSSVTVACQTQVQSVSVMTQTEYDELPGWKMIDDDRCSFTSNLSSNQHDVRNGSNLDSSQKWHCIMASGSKLRDVRKVRHVMSSEAKSCLSNKETYPSIVCNGNHTKKHNCSTDETVDCHTCAAKYLSSESDGACSALENFKLKNKVVQLPSCICSIQKQTEKNPNVDTDISKQLDERKQSDSSETEAVRECEQSGSAQMLQLDHVIHRQNAVDPGSSFGSLNSEDMMLDTEMDDTLWPNNVRSHHPSVDVGCLAHYCQSVDDLSSKCTAVLECCGHSGYQIKQSGNGVAPERSDSVGRKHFECMQNDSVDSLNHSNFAVIGDDIKHAVNGWIGLDPVFELSPTAIISRYVIVCVACIINSGEWFLNYTVFVAVDL